MTFIFTSSSIFSTKASGAEQIHEANDSDAHKKPS